ncbi:MAG TPA: recombinase zinc beta ribbon domain-containing protein, partial [Ktedonobacterales bacterium]|nr:recombinase zinc beta ribbon domain-containing protein [Ktedonobacterales bacterium]
VNPARPYLLRGMMRCGLCGDRFSTSWRRVQGGDTGAIWRFYVCATHLYRCQHARRRPGNPYPHDCMAAPLDADWVEGQVWSDLEQFIRNPGQTSLDLAARIQDTQTTADTHRTALAELQQALNAQQRQRDTYLELFGKGRINELDLNRQLDRIAQEEVSTTKERDALTEAINAATERQERVQRARTLLQQLHARLDAEGDTPAFRREAAELLVDNIRVETVMTGGEDARGRPYRQAHVHVTYIFEPVSQQRVIAPTRQR